MPKVKNYPCVEEQQAGIARWGSTLARHTKERDSIQASVAALKTGVTTQQAAGAPEPHLEATRKNLDAAQKRLREADALVAQASDRLNAAKSQKPHRYYTPKNRTLAEWKEEDNRLLTQQRATEIALNEARANIKKAQATPANDPAILKATRIADRIQTQVFDFDNRLQEIHEIVLGNNPK